MKKLIIGAAAAFAVVTAGALPSFIFGDSASATATPVVTTLTPPSGSPAGGNTVVVTGSALTDPADTAKSVRMARLRATLVAGWTAPGWTAPFEPTVWVKSLD